MAQTDALPLILAEPDRRVSVGEFNEKAYALKRKLESGFILDRELTQSVSLLAPVLIARQPFRMRDDEDSATDEGDTVEPRLSDLASLDLSVVDENAAMETIAALDALDEHVVRILELASKALRSSLRQSVDLGMIVEDYDTSDFSVPSVEDHDQNRSPAGTFARAVLGAISRLCCQPADSWLRIAFCRGSRQRMTRSVRFVQFSYPLATLLPGSPRWHRMRFCAA